MTASRLAGIVLEWEGVTAQGGEARFGRHSLGRFPRRVREGELERVIATFRARYEAARDAVDRRAGVGA